MRTEPRVRTLENPQPGFFKMRQVKHGPFVVARIQRGPDGWWAEIAGNRCDEPDCDPVRALRVMDIWLTAQEIEEAEYDRLLRTSRDKRHPASRPREPIELGKMKPLF